MSLFKQKAKIEIPVQQEDVTEEVKEEDIGGLISEISERILIPPKVNPKNPPVPLPSELERLREIATKQKEIIKAYSKEILRLQSLVRKLEKQKALFGDFFKNNFE